MLGEYGLGEFALGEFEADPPEPRTLIWPCEVAVSTSPLLAFASPPTLDASALLAGGSKGLLFAGNNTEQECSFQWLDAGASAVTETTVYLTLYVRWIDGAGDIWFRTHGGSIVAGVSVDDAGDLLIENDTVSDAPAESLGDQDVHRLDIKFVRNGACELQVDGGTAATVTGEDVATDCINMVFGSATSFEFHADAVWLSNTSFAPDGYAMTSLRPTGNGANVSGFDNVVVGSGTTAGEIDDDTVDGDTTKLASDVLDTNDRSFTCADLPAISYQSVGYVQGVISTAEAVSFTSDVQVYLGDDAAIISTAYDAGTSYEFVGVGSAVDGSSNPWTESSVNALEVGFRVTAVTQVLKVTAAWLDVMYVEVPDLLATLSGIPAQLMGFGFSSELFAAASSARASARAVVGLAFDTSCAAMGAGSQGAAALAFAQTLRPELVPVHQSGPQSRLRSAVVPEKAKISVESSQSSLTVGGAPMPNAVRHGSPVSALNSAQSPAAASATSGAQIAHAVTFASAPQSAAGGSAVSALTTAQPPSRAAQQSSQGASLWSFTISPAVVALLSDGKVAETPSIIETHTILQGVQVTGAGYALTASLASALGLQRATAQQSRWIAQAHAELGRAVTKLQQLGMVAALAPAAASQSSAGLTSALMVTATPARVRQLGTIDTMAIAQALASCRMLAASNAVATVATFSPDGIAQQSHLTQYEARLFFAAIYASIKQQADAFGVSAVINATATAARARVVGPAVSARFTVAVTPALQRWLPRFELGELIEVPLVTEIENVRVAVSGETIFWKLTPETAVDSLSVSWAPNGGAATVVDSIEGTHGTGDPGSWYGYFAPTLPPGQASGLWRWTARAVIGADEIVLKAGILRVVAAPN